MVSKRTWERGGGGGRKERVCKCVETFVKVFSTIRKRYTVF